jgi:hypothetical protein
VKRGQNGHFWWGFCARTNTYCLVLYVPSSSTDRLLITGVAFLTYVCCEACYVWDLLEIFAELFPHPLSGLKGGSRAFKVSLSSGDWLARCCVTTTTLSGNASDSLVSASLNGLIGVLVIDCAPRFNDHLKKQKRSGVRFWGLVRFPEAIHSLDILRAPAQAKRSPVSSRMTRY